jgi:hypothetical protein
MLEFIVLGDVPGTTLQITFKGALILGSVFMGGLLVRSVDKRLHRHRLELASE